MIRGQTLLRWRFYILSLLMTWLYESNIKIVYCFSAYNNICWGRSGLAGCDAENPSFGFTLVNPKIKSKKFLSAYICFKLSSCILFCNFLVHFHSVNVQAQICDIPGIQLKYSLAIASSLIRKPNGCTRGINEIITPLRHFQKWDIWDALPQL